MAYYTGLGFKDRLRRLVYLALLVTFAVVIHTVEAALPVPMPVPGVRIGLANIITLLTLVIFGLGSGLTVSVLRSVLGSLFVGGLFGFGFWLSLAAGLISCLAMFAMLSLRKTGLISLLSVSIVGAAVHNLTQLAMASLVVASYDLFKGYYPFLLLLSIPAGIFTGLAAGYLEGITGRILRQMEAGGR